ncbi:unnamed protein product (macronuclear) [Paramecium tetraurelia]|uniref:Uncharacterized protein n=1 Tax=Paramecium tetraurelia TaxID=5888 RepID=A0CG23_PARTE|nr:uncharacterized protein GSPATT00038183001 [Paramecium tetraurelia]CAK69740.1 unnamed protein product [Paramecium tetraurelia]|eukprot:XP_001437137.1 hypothetical protein (macronuclear) [Paramecium tetraurelia strain d4-2]
MGRNSQRIMNQQMIRRTNNSKAQYEGYQIEMNKYGDLKLIQRNQYLRRQIGLVETKQNEGECRHGRKRISDSGLDDNLPHQKKKDILKLQMQQLSAIISIGHRESKQQ